jgi:acetyl-CoA acetyltransferase
MPRLFSCDTSMSFSSLVNRLCGSGFQSVVNGTQEILVGDSSIVLTGGTDNMSACPYAVRVIRYIVELTLYRCLYCFKIRIMHGR